MRVAHASPVSYADYGRSQSAYFDVQEEECSFGLEGDGEKKKTKTNAFFSGLRVTTDPARSGQDALTISRVERGRNRVGVKISRDGSGRVHLAGRGRVTLARLDP